MCEIICQTQRYGSDKYFTSTHVIYIKLSKQMRMGHQLTVVCSSQLKILISAGHE